MTRAKYIAELDKDKEAELIRKYQETGDNESLKHILQSLEKCIYKASKNFVFVGPGGKNVFAIIFLVISVMKICDRKPLLHQ